MFKKIVSFYNMLCAMNNYYANARKSGEGVTTGYFWEAQLKERLASPKCLEQYGYKVFSQNDEDGIIAGIFNRIGMTNKIFIEFGVQNGLECNTHYLLFHDWKGLWIEGSPKYCGEILEKFRTVINSGQLKIANEFIMRENINDIFVDNGFSGEIDLLSIDIDGNDYHIFEAITSVNPRVVIIEYNAKFPPDCYWVMQYDEKYIWDGSDKQGASLKALNSLAIEKGYQLVGTNYNGVNAFFVRQDLTGDLFQVPCTPEMLYNPPRFWTVRYINSNPSKSCLKY